MEQLSGLDGMFLRTELPGLPMTISPLTIYDPSSAPDGIVRFKDILKVFEDGIYTTSLFRRRLVEVPFNLDHPYWIEDPDFDIEFHVRHIALPKPGDWRQLYIMVARLQSRPIDRNRPLWEAYVIEGLDNVEGVPKGSFAIMLKVHHAAMDGVTGVEVFTAMHDFEPSPPEKNIDKRTLLVEKRPSSLSLIGKAYSNYWKRTFKQPSLLKEGFKAYRRIQEGKKEGLFQNIEHKVHTRFNGSISPHRSVTKYTMPLAEIKAIKDIAGATVNDVMLCIVAGALRSYLADKDELPEHSLVAGCPINIRTEENKEVIGNIISLMNVAIRSDLENPMVRLLAVKQESLESKAYTKAMGPTMLGDVAEKLPPYLLSAGARVAVGMGDNMGVIHNLVVTNVPGLQFPAYFCGAKLIDSFGLGPCNPGVGLFHTVTSLYDNISISTIACRDMMPDPEFYRECLKKSFKELKASAQEYKP